MSHAMWNFKAWIRNVDNKQSRQSLAIIFLEQEQPAARRNVSNAREKASHKRESRRSRNFSLSRIDVSAFGGKVGDKRFFPRNLLLEVLSLTLARQNTFFYYLPVCKSHLHLENECMKWTPLYEEDTSAEKKTQKLEKSLVK